MVGQLPLEQHIGVRILAVSVKGRGLTSRSQVGSAASDLHHFAPDWFPDVYCGLVLASHLRQQVAVRRVRCIHLGSGCPHKQKASRSFVAIECRGFMVKLRARESLCCRWGGELAVIDPFWPEYVVEEGPWIYLLQFKGGTWTDVLGRDHLQHRH
jgi:hypothetical protein